jgi:hypothetical protein
MTTPNLSLKNWEDNIEQPDVPFNFNAAVIDALLQGAVESVENDAPTTVIGDVGKCWIVGSGTWPATPTAPSENDVAYCTAANVFLYLTPKEGWNLKDKDAGDRIEFNGTAWVSAGGGGGGGASIGVQYLADTGSTADSDPGAGLLKWNNATQASATVLYLDDSTDDGVSLTAWWAAMNAGGFCYLQHATNQDTWQIWDISSVVDASGYVKLGVALLADGGSFADGDPMLVTLQEGPPSTDRSTVTAVTSSSGAVTLNYALGDYFTITLSENVTSWVISNPPGSGKGFSLMVQITQDSTPRTVAKPGTTAGGVALDVSTASGDVDVLAISSFNNGTTLRSTIAKDFS